MTAAATKQFRILVVDDEDLARQRVNSLLSPRSDFEVIGECSTGAEAVRAIRELQPDVVLLDVQMPELDGFAVVHAIGVHRMPVTVFVTAFDQYALKAFEAHALDYLTKPFDRERFETSLGRAKHQVRLRERATTAGEALRAPAVLRRRGDQPGRFLDGARRPRQRRARGDRSHRRTAAAKARAIKKGGLASTLQLEKSC